MDNIQDNSLWWWK